jgi:hypothetical protein
VNAIRKTVSRISSYLRPKAENYLEIVLGIVLIAHGIVDGWPGAQLPAPDAFVFLSGNLAESIFAAWQLVSGFLLLIGVCRIGTPWSKRARRIGSFGAFLAFLFISVLGIISASNPIFWISTLGLAFISGILHIRTGWEDE